MTICRAARMHPLGVGAIHVRTRVLAVADDHHVTVVELATGQVRSTHQIQLDHSYWRNTQRARPLAELPKRRPMTRLM